MKDMIELELQAHKEVTIATIETLIPTIEKMTKIVIDTLQKGNKILICGNGGSASDAQHIVAELVGRYKSTRRGLPAIALNTDTSALTAIANDFGYKMVFSRQIEALANSGDLLIVISTSGNSANIIEALGVAREMGCSTLGLSGRDGGEMNSLCDINLIVPSNDTPRIQEIHIVVGHILSQGVDNIFG
jgi:D-sedoheptulose 7-phosphate isomerase